MTNNKLHVFQTSRCFTVDNLPSVGWTLRVLQPHPHLVKTKTLRSKTEGRLHCGDYSALTLFDLHLFCLQLSFIGYQAQQVVLVLSDLQEPVLSPVQSVLLFQRCRILLACLQYNSQLAQHLRSHFREEFRFVLLLVSAQESGWWWRSVHHGFENDQMATVQWS